MKKRLIALACVLLMVLGLPGMACAATPRASDYFGATAVYAWALDDREILIEFDINATHTMLEVGATQVYIFEQQSDGSYDIVYTFDYRDAGYYGCMMDTNSMFGTGEVSYYGTPGVNYYAKCALYARDRTGGQTLYFNTLIVTCTENA